MKLITDASGVAELPSLERFYTLQVLVASSVAPNVVVIKRYTRHQSHTETDLPSLDNIFRYMGHESHTETDLPSLDDASGVDGVICCSQCSCNQEIYETSIAHRDRSAITG
ncbi:hypothetical protein J6590_047914 [Homalodisca vitripennis]|nr:hypothetical protein J6590_047914 [Homalodisca vitripennis]